MEQQNKFYNQTLLWDPLDYSRVKIVKKIEGVAKIGNWNFTLLSKPFFFLYRSQ